MTPQELKNSILQLAIQGRLVEQRPEEGTAEELYRQIQREKAALVKAGKIKKEKPLPEITEGEVPFEIPEGWKWVRLNSITFNHGQTVPAEDFSYIDIGSIDNKNQRLSPDDNIIAAEKAPSRARRIVVHGDILYATVRPYLHNMCIVDREFSRQPIASTGFAVMSCPAGIYNKYLFYYLLSPSFDSYANNTENAKGVAYPAINDDRLYRAVIALPPLAEQKRIVAKIEELLPYIERYEKAWSRLEDFNKRFPTDMQKSILQLAIQGKLVPQRPSGKLKKEKPLPEITPDEIPFDIPESWKWVRLNDIVDVRDGTHDTPQYVSKGYPLITGKDFYYGVFDFSKTQYISEYDYQLIIQRSRVDVGDILFSMIGGNIGSMIKITEENYFEMGIKNVALYKRYSKDLSFSDYLYVYLKSQVTEFKKIAKGGAQSFVPLKLLRNYLIPLPPLAEQKRIVAKLEELLPMCEGLKS